MTSLQHGHESQFENAWDILENASLGVHLVAADGTILWANKTELELLGYEQAEYVGHNITEFHVCQEVISDILARLTRFETLQNYEAILRCKDGSQRFVQINSNVFKKEGKFHHTRCFTRDITDLKAAQLNLLKEQQQRLQQAEIYKTEQRNFIDTICHELRNPLNGVFGALELIKEEMENMKKTISAYKVGLDRNMTALSHFMQNIEECASHQQMIVNDVLDLSKLDAHEVHIDSSPFAPHRLIESAVRIFHSAIFQKNLKVAVVDGMQNTSTVTTAESLRGRSLAVQQQQSSQKQLVTYTDPLKLKQVLVNLISNAIKFTPELGTITITYRAAMHDNTLHIEVEDSGVGLTQEESAKLFERFSQIRNKTDHTYNEGSGLGLSISKGLVELLGGSIKVESEKNVGSKFVFFVKCDKIVTGSSLKDELEESELALSPTNELAVSSPIKSTTQLELIELSKSSGTTSTEETSPRSSDSSTTSSGQTMLEPALVLVVEDNTINQKILGFFLSKLGLDFDIAENADACLKKMASRKYDLILMDIELGSGMNGIECTKVIRQKDDLIPIICVSGYAREEYKMMAYRVGMNDYITKPYKKEDIFDKVGHWIGKRRGSVPTFPAIRRKSTAW